MGNFAKALHHLDIKDVKRKRLEEIAAKKIKEQQDIKEKKIIKEISKKYKSDWKREIYEGMTTGNALSTVLPAEGEVAINTVDTIDSESYSPVKMPVHIGQEGGVGDDGVFDSAFVGTVIRDSGTGNGSDGGFNVGGQYLAFQGTGAPNNNARFACLNPIDSTGVDTLTITAIVGNDTNGGEDPDLVAEYLGLLYKTPAMERAQFLQITPQTTLASGVDNRIIVTPLSHDGGLNNYSITIPEYARAKDTVFVLYQNFNSGSEFDNYGVTKINFKRRNPVNVVVPLDDPEAISFVRVGSDEGDPKKRKKKLNDQLAASDEYTSSVLGDQFPGEGARVDGEDPFKSATVTSDDVINASPIGNNEVKKSFDDFQQGQKKVEVLKTPEQIKAQNDEYYADLNNMLERGNYSYDDPQIVEIADKIIKLDPTSTDAYLYKSGYYDANGEPEKSLGVLDQLIKNNPNNSIGHLVRSYYREESGDLAGAIEDLEKGIELDPDASYVSYYEMELADLKFQEAEVETNNAKRDRMESEAGAIEAKAHEDYWNNADLIEQEEPVEYEYVDDETLLNDFKNNRDSDLQPGIRRSTADWATQMEVIDPIADGDTLGLSDVYYKLESWEGTPEEFAEYYANWEVTNWFKDPGDARLRTWSYNNMIKKLNSGNNISIGKSKGELGKYKVSDIEKMSPDEVIGKFETTIKREYEFFKRRYDTDYQQASSKTNDSVYYLPGKLHNIAKYLKTLSENLPDYYFDSKELTPVNTLYDQMKALYDEKDPEKEIKTELKAQGYEKQYKDLMSAWDSADKFSKFLTPLKNLSDALLGSKTAQNAQYENYKIAIAKSIMLNKPIRVNPDTIDPVLIKKLGDRITPNQILSYEYEQKFKDMQERYAKLVKQGKGDPNLLYDYDQPSADGIPLIPIVSEPVPYADENIYEDEFGKVFTNDGSVANTTFQPDRGYHGFANAYVTDMMRKNPIAGRGQAQYQIVVPPDGTEPYLLYKDHAYHNVKSTDEGEVPGFMNQGASGFVNWLGNTAHARGDGDANSGGMSGYPPNIRGDVITQFRINLTDLPEDVQGAVYRHPLMTEQPELVQLLRDKFYTDDKIKRFNIGGETGKELHNLYTNVILKRADELKDFITDNRVELVLRGIGKITGAEDVGNITTASNMLQRYDDYIQQTVYTSDGRAYIPGVTTPDGNVISRININDQFTKGSQNKLQSLMNDKEVQALVKRYVDIIIKSIHAVKHITTIHTCY